MVVLPAVLRYCILVFMLWFVDPRTLLHPGIYVMVVDPRRAVISLASYTNLSAITRQNCSFIFLRNPAYHCTKLRLPQQRVNYT